MSEQPVRASISLEEARHTLSAHHYFDALPPLVKGDSLGTRLMAYPEEPEWSLDTLVQLQGSIFRNVIGITEPTFVSTARIFNRSPILYVGGTMYIRDRDDSSPSSEAGTRQPRPYIDLCLFPLRGIAERAYEFGRSKDIPLTRKEYRAITVASKT